MTLLLGALLLGAAHGEGPLHAQHLPIFNLTTDDGLAASQVWDILHDRRGYIWVATSEGLNRYDGFELQSFTGTDGLRNQVVRKVVEAPDGALWLGTSDGLARFDGRGFTFLGKAEGLRGGIVWDLGFDRHGNLWFGTGAGLGVRSGRTVRWYDKGSGLAADDVYSLHLSRQGEIWIGTRHAGVAHCAVRGAELGACHRLGAADGLPGQSVHAITEDGFGRIWIGTRDGGLARWDGQSLVTFGTAQGLADLDIYSLLVRRDGELVVGTAQKGITICSLPDLTACRSIGKANGLIVDAVLGVREDREGSLWIGENNGLSKLVSEKLLGFDDRQGVPGPGGYALLPERDGAVWVGTFGGLARIRLGARYEPPVVQAWSTPGLPSSEIWDVLRDRAGRLWVGTARGLCRFDEARGSCGAVYGEAQGLAGSYVLDLLETRGGDLWVGTLTGVSRLRFGGDGRLAAVLTLGERDGLPAAQVQNVAEDAHGTVWLACSGGGLASFRDGKLRVWTSARGLPSQSIYGLFAASDGNLWIGTGGSGLVGFRPGPDPATGLRFRVYGSDEGITARAVYAIREADRGRLWLGTTSGVFLFDPAANGGRGRVLRHFDKASGLISKDISTGNSLAVDSRGRLWMGFSGGIAVYDERLDDPVLPPPRVSLERITVGRGTARSAAPASAATLLRAPFSAPPRLRPGERWLDPSTPLVLPPGQHNLRFDYRALTYRAPREVRYEVQLVGFDPGWSPAGTDPFKEYTNLDPGSYRFRVRAGSETSWGPVTALGVTLQPAIWQTTPFGVGAILVAVGALIVAHRRRTFRIKQRASALETEVLDRTDDLRRYARALEEHSHALDRANARIRQTNRFKSQFLANMSHELRTPLNAIIGFSQVLERRLGPRIEPREIGFLHNVLESGKHLLHLIDNLLDLSKIEAGRMEVHVEQAELKAVVDGVRTIMEGYWRERGVTVTNHLPSHLVPIAVDVPKLKQILFNLLSNAIKFSSPGGTVELAADVISGVESPLAVDSYALVVRDHGIGIPLEDQARIFEEFRQVHHGGDRPAGTGLGLAIVYRFVRLLGGEIDLDSEPGQGATFRVLLPREASERLTPVALSEETAGEPASARPRVLVVEGDRETFARLAEALEAENMLPVRARHGEEALLVAREVHPAAVAINVSGSTLDGWSVISDLQRDPTTAALPIVLMSLRDHSRAGMALAFDAWLTKPIEPRAFLIALERFATPGDAASAVPVLVVDDDPATRELLEVTLASAGLPILTANERRRAVELARAHRPLAIAVSLTMSGLEGFALTRALQRDARTSRIPVLALAPPQVAEGDRQRIAEQLVTAAGAGGPAAELIATVQAVLRRQRRPPAAAGWLEESPHSAVGGG